MEKEKKKKEIKYIYNIIFCYKLNIYNKLKEIYKIIIIFPSFIHCDHL